MNGLRQTNKRTNGRTKKRTNARNNQYPLPAFLEFISKCMGIHILKALYLSP